MPHGCARSPSAKHLASCPLIARCEVGGQRRRPARSERPIFAATSARCTEESPIGPGRPDRGRQQLFALIRWRGRTLIAQTVAERRTGLEMQVIKALRRSRGSVILDADAVPSIEGVEP